MRFNRIAIALTLANFVLLVLVIGRESPSRAAAAIEPVLRAELIELVDQNGMVRGQMRTEEDGTVVFRLRDRNGTVRVKLAADEMGSGLLLADDRTEVGVHILSGISRLTGKNDTMITLADAGGARQVIRPAGLEAGR